MNNMGLFKYDKIVYNLEKQYYCYEQAQATG